MRFLSYFIAFLFLFSSLSNAKPKKTKRKTTNSKTSQSSKDASVQPKTLLDTLSSSPKLNYTTDIYYSNLTKRHIENDLMNGGVNVSTFVDEKAFQGGEAKFKEKIGLATTYDKDNRHHRDSRAVAKKPFRKDEIVGLVSGILLKVHNSEHMKTPPTSITNNHSPTPTSTADAVTYWDSTCIKDRLGVAVYSRDGYLKSSDYHGDYPIDIKLMNTRSKNSDYVRYILFPRKGTSPFLLLPGRVLDTSNGSIGCDIANHGNLRLEFVRLKSNNQPVVAVRANTPIKRGDKLAFKPTFSSAFQPISHTPAYKPADDRHNFYQNLRITEEINKTLQPEYQFDSSAKLQVHKIL